MVEAPGKRVNRKHRSIDKEVQSDLDALMEQYNTEYTNQGRYGQWCFPCQTFLEGLGLYQQHVYEGEET